ncbi:MAG TPA: IclR family transcriptional regulator C-terminal domain-containing protein, partial [Acidimicrobiales bacterium]|nr:IclR family transcriptional regulator C-terminal domain-containing protein [Acidimicrobiales bacterium]
RVGRPSVLHATATGKVLLAFGGARVPEALVAYTERTITDPAELERELERVRASGIAQAAGEREPDLAALAAPVLGRGGVLAAILGLQGPAVRVRVAALREPLRRAAEELTRSLGGPAQLQG